MTENLIGILITGGLAAVVGYFLPDEKPYSPVCPACGFWTPCCDCNQRMAAVDRELDAAEGREVPCPICGNILSESHMGTWACPVHGTDI